MKQYDMYFLLIRMQRFYAHHYEPVHPSEVTSPLEFPIFLTNEYS